MSDAPAGDAPPTGRRRSHQVLLCGVAAGFVVVDQLTKWWALERLSDGRVVDVVGTLRFALTFNTGASFGLAGDYGPLIGVLALGIVGVLVWQGSAVSTRTGAVAVGMILGGALGNLGDRVFRGDGIFDGAVVDFIDLQWWPVFNVADIGVVVGVLLLLVSTFLGPGDADGASDGA